MRKLAIVKQDEVTSTDTYPVPVKVTGLVWSRLMSPPDYALWLAISEIHAGAQLIWDGHHSEQAIYVFSGSLSVGDHTCPAGGAVIIESDVPATVTATERSVIGHWGSWDRVPPTNSLGGPPKSEGHRVHVIGPKGRFTAGDPDNVAVRSFADSTCETCRVSFFEVTRRHERAGRPHSHSADEIIYLTDGTIQLGAYTLQPGTALCIPSEVRYAEGAGPDGAVFLNFRREASNRTNVANGQVTSVEIEDGGRSLGHFHRNDDVVDVLA